MNTITPPQIFSDFTLDLFNVHQTRMQNGQKVFFIDNYNSDIIKVSFIFRAGLKYGNPAVIKLLGKVLFDGSKSLKGDLLADKIDSYGAYIFNKAGSDRFIVSLVCQKKVFKDVWPVFVEAVFSPELNKEKIFNAAKREVNHLKEAYQYNTVIAEEHFMPAILGNDNPYNQVLLPHNFEQISPTDIVTFHDQFFNIDNGYVLVSGNTDDSIKSLIVSIDDYSGNGFTANEVDLPQFKYKPVEKFIKNPYSSQSYILIGNQTITKNHPDYIKLKIVSTLLGGYIGSRLMQNIREKSGYTYDIYSSLIGFEQIGLLRIASEFQTGSEQIVLKEIQNEISKLKEEFISKEELIRLQNYLSGELLGAFDGMFARDGSFSSVYNFGLELDYYQNFLDEVKGINSEAIQNIVSQYIDFKSFTKIFITTE